MKGELYDNVKNRIESLIVEDEVDTFLFERKSEFDILCYFAVTKLKEKYPHIKRIYARTDFPFIHGGFVDHDEDYDDAYYPGRILHDGDRNIIYRGQSEKEWLAMSGTCLLYDEKGLCDSWFDFEYARQNKVCIMYMGK